MPPRKQPKFGYTGVYNVTLPTYNDKEGVALQTDVNGRLLTMGATGGTAGSTAPTSSSVAGAVYNTSPPTYTNGALTQNQADVNGNMKVVEQYAPAAEDNAAGVIKTEQRYSSAAISTATTTVVKSGSGFIQTISIVGGTLGAITVYDNTAASGTAILPTFTPTATLPAPSIDIYSTFATGLTVVTAAATIIQISYR